MNTSGLMVSYGDLFLRLAVWLVAFGLYDGVKHYIWQTEDPWVNVRHIGFAFFFVGYGYVTERWNNRRQSRRLGEPT